MDFPCASLLIRVSINRDDLGDANSPFGVAHLGSPLLSLFFFSLFLFGPSSPFFVLFTLPWCGGAAPAVTCND